MKLVIKILFVSLAVYATIFQSLFAQNKDAGARLLELNQFNRAKVYYNAILKETPSNSQAWLNLGEIYFKTDNLDSAIVCYTKGIEKNNMDPYNFIGLAKAAKRKGDSQTAKINIDKAMKLAKSSKDVNFFVYLADAYFSNKDYDQALTTLDIAKGINNKLADIFILIGDIQMAQSKAGEAANSYDRATFYNKNSTKGFYRLGQLYVLAWNVNEAQANFQKALLTDSTYIPVYKDMGELYYRAGMYDKASYFYTQYIRMNENNPSDNARYAQILYFCKNYAKSSEFIDKVLKKDSSNFVLLRLQSYNSYELNDYVKGMRAINKFFKLVNKDNKLISKDYEYYSKLLSKTNKDSLAIINFLITLKMDSSKTDFYELIANSYERLKKYKEAAMYYQKFIKKNKQPQVNDYYQLGKVCYILITDTEKPLDSLSKKLYSSKADSAFAKVIELIPGQHIGYLYRARVNSVLDPDAEKGLAKPYYEEVVKITEPVKEKYLKELVESFSYLGYYYYVKNDIESSKSFWKKILELDPNDTKAQDAIKGLTKPKTRIKKK